MDRVVRRAAAMVRVRGRLSGDGRRRWRWRRGRLGHRGGAAPRQADPAPTLPWAHRRRAVRRRPVAPQRLGCSTSSDLADRGIHLGVFAGAEAHHARVDVRLIARRERLVRLEDARDEERLGGEVVGLVPIGVGDDDVVEIHDRLREELDDVGPAARIRGRPTRGRRPRMRDCLWNPWCPSPKLRGIRLRTPSVLTVVRALRPARYQDRSRVAAQYWSVDEVVQSGFGFGDGAPLSGGVEP